jgi:tetratricopeptide (TPR) repeat protein
LSSPQAQARRCRSSCFTLRFVQTVTTSLLLIVFSLLPRTLYAQGPAERNSFATLTAKAAAARDADRLDEAASLYKKALQLRPNWAEGWWSLGTIAYDQNSYAEAVRAFRKAAEFAPKNGNAYVMLGLSEFELGRDLLALEHIEKGASLGLSENPDLRRVALYHEGVVLQRLGRFQSAQETLEDLCIQGVQSDELANTLGMVLLRSRGKNSPSPGSEDAEIVASIGRAGCLARQKKFEESRTQMADLVGGHPEYANIHYAFGVLLLEAGDLQAAIAQFKEEIKRDPGDVVARLQIAAAMYRMDSAGGIPYARQAVKLAPQEPFAHLLLGMLLLDTDDYLEAIPELEIARKSFPRESRIYFALGTAYSRAGRSKEAAQARATFTQLTAEAEKSKSSEGQAEPAVTDHERIPVRDMTSPPQ